MVIIHFGKAPCFEELLADVGFIAKKKTEKKNAKKYCRGDSVTVVYGLYFFHTQRELAACNPHFFDMKVLKNLRQRLSRFLLRACQ